MDSNTTVSLPHGYRLQGEKNEYVIDRVLGQGAFGITYLARYKAAIQGSMGKGSVWAQVAVKEFFMKDMNVREGSTGYLNEVSQDSLVGRYRRAFMREARNLASLHHPNIVNVFEVIEANNTVYIVMEYINGGSLDEYLSSHGQLTEEATIVFMKQIMSAVKCMHDNKMLHLDLKPKNIMLDEDEKVYLIDFGLSKQFMSNGEPESSTSLGLGTPGYAPLEQAEHQDGETKFRATLDVYSLGATMYKMLLGKTPPLASKVSDSVLEGENILIEQLKTANVNDSIASFVATAMWPSSKKRYQSLTEMIEAFDCIISKTESKPESTSEMTFKLKPEPISKEISDENTIIISEKQPADSVIDERTTSKTTDNLSSKIILKRNKEIREAAHHTLKGHWGLAILVCLVNAIISIFISAPDTITNTYITLAAPESYNVSLITMLLILFGFINGIGTIFFVNPLDIGLNNSIKTMHQEKDYQTIGNMFHLGIGYGHYWRNVAGKFLIQLCTLLWLLLLIIPGIIKSYAYSMTPFILNDNPEIGPNEARLKSIELMRGHKWKLLGLDLSFIGWFLLSILSFGIGLIWLIPYFKTARAAFYCNLMEAQNQKPLHNSI